MLPAEFPRPSTRRSSASKKFLAVAGTALLFTVLPGGRGTAQSVSVSLGASASPTGHPTLNAGLTVRNVALLAGYGLSARLIGDIGPGGGVEAAGLFDFPLDIGGRRLTLYAGPGVSLHLGTGPRLRPAFTGGVAYDLDGQLGLYAEAVYRIRDAYRIRAGVTYLF